LNKNGNVLACGSSFVSGVVDSNETDILEWYIPRYVLKGGQNNNTTNYLQDITKIKATSGGIFYFETSGFILTCGYNNKGQLGIGNNTEIIRIPTYVLKGNQNNNITDYLQEIINIDESVLYMNCTYFLTKQGNILACGDNFNMQTGFSDRSISGTWYSPRYVKVFSSDSSDTILSNIIEISHQFFKDNIGNIYTTPSWNSDFTYLFEGMVLLKCEDYPLNHLDMNNICYFIQHQYSSKYIVYVNNDHLKLVVIGRSKERHIATATSPYQLYTFDDHEYTEKYSPPVEKLN